MRREAYGVQRTDWRKLVLQHGLVYSPTAKPDGSIMDYWREGPYYSFTLNEITVLEAASRTIFNMLIEAGDYIVAHPEIMRKMGIPEFAWNQIIKSWDQEPAWGSVYGRYDIRFGGLDNDDPELRSPGCTSSTPTPRPASWKLRSRSGSGFVRLVKATTSGTTSVNSWSWPGVAISSSSRRPSATGQSCTSPAAQTNTAARMS